jgi:hypothetical protein
MEKTRKPIEEFLQFVVFIEGPQRPPKRVGVGVGPHVESSCPRFEGSAHALPNFGPALTNGSLYGLVTPADPEPE